MLKIDTHLQIGAHHTNHCEDYLITEKIGKNTLLLAVCDGCTMGNESWFASALIGKLLKKLSREIYFREMYEPLITSNLKELERLILQRLFSELKQIQQQLFLETEDLLSTLILVLIDEEKRSGRIIAIGDGLVKINDDIFDFDQNNKPDYLGLHLQKKFVEWHSAQSQIIDFQKIASLIISTDGIFSFLPFRYSKNMKSIDAQAFLLKERTENLKQKMLILEEEYHLKPADDFAVISISFT